MSFTFLCTLTAQEPTFPISYVQYIISAASWAAARSHQFLIPIHRWLEENPCAESVGPELYRQANKLIMAKGRLMDIKREEKSVRKVVLGKSDNNSDMQTVDNLDAVQKKNDVRRKKEEDSIFGFRQTVIRNLPQLQKLDNVPVSSEEMVR